MWKLLHRNLPLYAPDETGGGQPSAPSGGGSSSPAASAPSAEPAGSPSPAPTGGSGVEGAPAAPSTRSTSIGEIPSDIMALFNGDPISPTSEPVQAQPGQTPPAGPLDGSPQGVDPSAQQAPQQAATVPQGPSAEALAAQISTLTEIVSRQQPAAPQQPQGPQAPEVAIPDHGYQFNIPEGLDTALVSDDPATRRTALQALIQGTSRTVHTEVVKSMRQEFARILPQIVNSMITQSRSQQNVAQDFYGKYTQFANPIFRPLVQQIGMQVARERGAQGWTPELRDAIGERVLQVLQAAGFQGQGGAPQVPAPSLNGPAAIVPGGARPASSSDPTAQFRELL